MRFNTEHTQGGYKILSLHGPDIDGSYAAIVKPDINTVRAIEYWGDGTPSNLSELEAPKVWNLIPLAPTVVQSEWRNVYPARLGANFSSRKLADELCDVARIGVLRVDWLSDGTFKVEVE